MNFVETFGLFSRLMNHLHRADPKTAGDYSIDYFYDNEKKGVLQNLTKEVGGKVAKYDDRTINFMTTHRASYKQLASNDSEYSAIAAVESDKHKNRFNKGVAGRGQASLSQEQKEGIRALTRHYLSTDFSQLGL